MLKDVERERHQWFVPFYLFMRNGEDAGCWVREDFGLASGWDGVNWLERHLLARKVRMVGGDIEVELTEIDESFMSLSSG